MKKTIRFISPEFLLSPVYRLLPTHY